MPVKIEYDEFKFSQARYIKPTDFTLRGFDVANEFVAKANQLVREIARAGWDVPGINVKIRYYGAGKNVFKHCSEISFESVGEDGTAKEFSISYFNPVGKTGRWNHTASASGIQFGDDWKNRLSLDRDGGAGWRSVKRLKRVIEALESVLAKVAATPSKEGHDIDHPEGDLNLREICTVERTPAPADFPVIYAKVRQEDVYPALGLGDRWTDPEFAADSDYRLRGKECRFANTNVGLKWEEISSEAWESYQFASPDINASPAGLSMPNSSGFFPVEIKLQYLDDVFVADMAPFENSRDAAEAVHKAEGRGWGEEEYTDCIRRSLRTFTPASEYRGGYEKPVFMIGRLLHEDEARGMAGPVSVVVEDGFVVSRMHDNKSGRDVILYEGGSEAYHRHRAVDAAQKVARIFNMEPSIDPEIAAALEAHRQRLREEYKDDKTMQMLIA
jgi:hypothetical protein